MAHLLKNETNLSIDFFKNDHTEMNDFAILSIHLVFSRRLLDSVRLLLETHCF